MSHASEQLVIAVDGGGSTCRVRLCRASGAPLAEVKGPSANVTTNFNECRANVLSTAARAYAEAGLDPARMDRDVAFLGLAGANVGDAAKRMQDSLGFHRVRVVSDRDITVHGALGREDGALAQVGTGSFFSVQLGGEIRNVGGWGFQLSDDCSGAYLGRKLLRTAVAAHDGLRDPSPLTTAILARFGGTPDKLITYIQNATPLDYGSFAPELVAAEEAGDAVAQAILADAVSRMVHILDVMDVESAGRLCLMGGVGPAYATRLPERYRAILAEPQGNGLDGAVAMARRELLGADL